MRTLSKADFPAGALQRRRLSVRRTPLYNFYPSSLSESKSNPAFSCFGSNMTPGPKRATEESKNPTEMPPDVVSDSETDSLKIQICKYKTAMLSPRGPRRNQ